MKLIFIIVVAALPSCSQLKTQVTDTPLNSIVLASVRSMPKGSGYDASQAAVDRLAACVSLKNGIIKQDLKAAKSTFCSGATYLVFLRTIEQLRLHSSTFLPEDKYARFANLGVKDGEEIFGRWNANGPGTAKLFSDLNCGVNFTSYDHAQAGDFMKMWWTNSIGKRERGHSVIYLGSHGDQIHYWSANQPEGYGRKSVAKSQIKHVLFSRLTNPAQLIKANLLSPKDLFLEDMLYKDFTWRQISQFCNVKAHP
ncbi:MAG: hypothetical protein P8M04_07800 [Akkermansiaceae bacterium]|nr:hypothetical protein [Akkermansiaceae bacterium]